MNRPIKQSRSFGGRCGGRVGGKRIGHWLVLIVAMVFSSTALIAAEVEKPDRYTLKLAMETSASKETIWRVWSEVENWKEFDTLLEYSQLDEGDSFEKGAKGEVKAEGSPKTRFELTEVEDGVSFVETLKLPLYQRIDLVRYFETDKKGKTVFVHEVRFRGRLRFITRAFAAKTFTKELPLVMGRLREYAEDIELNNELN